LGIKESDVYFIIQVSDETLLAKLNEHCVQHPHFESRASKKFLSDLTLPHGSFRLKHYAGSVSTEDQAPKSLNFCLEILLVSTHKIFEAV